VAADTDAANLPKASPSQKLVIFTEHRDTLSYLEQRISTLLGRKEAVVCIHGGMHDATIFMKDAIASPMLRGNC
jgi:hypothetical protein